MGDKQRVYTFLDSENLTRIDTKAGDMGVSRSELIRIAIEQYLTANGDKNLTPSDEVLIKKDGEITQKDQEITLLNKEIESLNRLLGTKDGEIQHLRYLTNDLRSLADNLASKVPALPGPSIQATEEVTKKSWWHFW
jgi:Ribbon-helix-helix protein, copG family